MQLRLVKRLLRLDANRNSYVPNYQQHYPLALVVDSQNPQHQFHPPHRRPRKLPLAKWWNAFGGEEPPQPGQFGIMFTGHRKPGLFGLLGQPSTNSYRDLLRRGRSEKHQRLASSRLRRLSHLHRPLPPLLALQSTYPLPRRRWRSREERSRVPTELLKRSEARRLEAQRRLGQQQQYNRWVRDLFQQEGRKLLAVTGSQARPVRHFMAQPRPGYQLHYSGYQTTPLWVYAAGLRAHLSPLAVDRRWWRRLQRRVGQPRPRSFWSGYAKAGQRLLQRERWLQLRLERYPLELLRRRFDRSLEMAERQLLVADPQAIRDSRLPNFWNKWAPLRRHLGQQWRYLQRYFAKRLSMEREPRLLAMQLQVDFHLLQRNLALLQRQELLDPFTEYFEVQRVQQQGALLRKDDALRTAAGYLRWELRRRPADRGSFGALLEPLLGRQLPTPGSGLRSTPLGQRGGLNLGPQPPTLGSLAGRSRSESRRQRRRRRLQQRLGLRLRRSPQHLSSAHSPLPEALLLPRPLKRGRRRLGFGDYLTETLGVAGPDPRQRLGQLNSSSAAFPLLRRRPEQRPLSQRREGLRGLALRQGLGQSEDPAGRQRLGYLSGGLRSLQLQESGYGRGYRREERLRCGPLNRGLGARQVQLRGRREGLLSSYLHVETDLHPIRGWPVDYHREQCWDLWRLDRSLLPVTTLERLNLKLENFPQELRNYLLGRRDYYTPEQWTKLQSLRGRDLEDYEKKVVAELKKLCPPVLRQDRLDMDPIWHPGLERWRPRHVAQASLFQGRPRRRCTQGTNRGARATARLYQRVFLPRLMGALAGEYKMIRQLMPYTIHHPHSYRWRRLGRRWRHYGASLGRFVRWGPRYGLRVNRVLRRGRRLKPRQRRRLFTREDAGGGEDDPNATPQLPLPATDWRLRLQQLRERQRWTRLGHFSLTWMNYSVSKVRTDARANLVTGVISHLRWSYDYVLRKRRVLAYRSSRKRGWRLELMLRRWRHGQQQREPTPVAVAAQSQRRPLLPHHRRRRRSSDRRWRLLAYRLSRRPPLWLKRRRYRGTVAHLEVVRNDRGQWVPRELLEQQQKSSLAQLLGLEEKKPQPTRKRGRPQHFWYRRDPRPPAKDQPWHRPQLQPEDYADPRDTLHQSNFVTPLETLLEKEAERYWAEYLPRSEGEDSSSDE